MVKPLLSVLQKKSACPVQSLDLKAVLTHILAQAVCLMGPL